MAKKIQSFIERSSRLTLGLSLLVLFFFELLTAVSRRPIMSKIEPVLRVLVLAALWSSWWVERRADAESPRQAKIYFGVLIVLSTITVILILVELLQTAG